MREKDQNNMCETEAVFTFTMLLMNVLILAIIGAVGWLIHTVITENNSLNAIARGGFLP